MSVDIRRLPVQVRRSIPSAPVPLNYQQAVQALSECQRVDECKDIDNKCVAIAAYAKQVKDTAMLDMVKRIRLRATRRIGELLADLPGASSREISPARIKAAREAGVSANVVQTALRIAYIPDEKFCFEVENSDPVPSPTSLASKFYGGPRGSGIIESAAAIELRRAISSMKVIAQTKAAKDFASQLFGSADGQDYTYLAKTRTEVRTIIDWLDTLDQHLVLLARRRRKCV